MKEKNIKLSEFKVYFVVFVVVVVILAILGKITTFSDLIYMVVLFFAGIGFVSLSDKIERHYDDLADLKKGIDHINQQLEEINERINNLE